MNGLRIIDEELMYNILSIPTFTGMEYRMIDFLLKYLREKDMMVELTEMEILNFTQDLTEQ